MVRIDLKRVVIWRRLNSLPFKNRTECVYSCLRLRLIRVVGDGFCMFMCMCDVCVCVGARMDDVNGGVPIPWLHPAHAQSKKTKTIYRCVVYSNRFLNGSCGLDAIFNKSLLPVRSILWSISCICGQCCPNVVKWTWGLTTGFRENV